MVSQQKHWVASKENRNNRNLKKIERPTTTKSGRTDRIGIQFVQKIICLRCITMSAVTGVFLPSETM